MKNEEIKPTKALVQRDEKGRLLPGSKLAVGATNPQHSIRQTLHNAFLNAVGTDRLIEVINRHLELIQEAKPKEAAALIELLYQYALGKPIATVQMDVTKTEANAPTINLDAEDLAALERMRTKLNHDNGEQ